MGMPRTGLRERKKQETRLALRSAALRLTAERGLENVTVEEIAAAADVSARTFFNYYSSKEEALVGVEPGEFAGLLTQLDLRPVDEEPLFSVHAVLRDMALVVNENRDLYVMRMKVIADNPGLLPRHVAGFVEFERLLVEALQVRKTRSAVPLAASTLIVASAVSALRVSVELWISDDGNSTLPELFDVAIQHLAIGLVAQPGQHRAKISRTKMRKDLT